MRYEPIPEFTRDEVVAAIERDDPDVLLYAVLSAALHDEDPAWAARISLRLVAHPHWNVRGNALLALGHIARLHRWLPREEAQAALAAGLRDPEEYVRGKAESAADDVEQFLGWRFRENPLRDWHDGLPVPGVRFLRNDRVQLAGGDGGTPVQGVVFGLLRIAPEPEYLVDVCPDDPESTFPARTATERDLRPLA